MKAELSMLLLTRHANTRPGEYLYLPSVDICTRKLYYGRQEQGITLLIGLACFGRPSKQSLAKVPPPALLAWSPTSSLRPPDLLTQQPLSEQTADKDRPR